MVEPHKRHIGDILLSDFIIPLDICQCDLAMRLDISLQELERIISGEQKISPDLAIRLAIELGTTPDFWNESEL